MLLGASNVPGKFTELLSFKSDDGAAILRSVDIEGAPQDYVSPDLST